MLLEKNAHLEEQLREQSVRVGRDGEESVGSRSQQVRNDLAG